MRLAALGVEGVQHVARVEDGEAVLLPYPSLEELLAEDHWHELAAGAPGTRRALEGCAFLPLVSRPSKVIGVGLNYRSHIEEMGRDVPDHPTLFAKVSGALIGAHDDIHLPPESTQVDWEVELAIVIGRAARRVSAADAATAIAGYTVVNDVSMRDWQWRTSEWLQGKSFEHSSPIGPVLVTLDELPSLDQVEIECRLNGTVVQHARADDLVFGPPDLVAYISTFTTLLPGDVIATGTPGGVGAGRTPKWFLRSGDILESTIVGIGTCTNRCITEPVTIHP